MSLSCPNLSRTPAFHKGKGVNFLLRPNCQAVRLVCSLIVALLMMAGCVATDARTFPQQTGELSADIEAFRNDEGEAVISLFAVAEGFPDDMEKAWQNQRVKIASCRAHALFKDVPYGEYALSVLHDEDGDNQMKSSWLGQPLEGFGFSGRPEYHFGPPAFADAAFLMVSATREIVVRMRYDTVREKKQGERRATLSGQP